MTTPTMHTCMRAVQAVTVTGFVVAGVALAVRAQDGIAQARRELHDPPWEVW